MFSQQYRSDNQSWFSNKAIKSSIEYHHITDDILSGRIKNIDTLVRCCLKLRDELMNFNGVDFTTSISKLQYEFLLLMYKWVIASSLDNADVIKQFNINIPEVQKTLLSTLFETWTDISVGKPLPKGVNQCHYKCKSDEIQYILDLLNHAGISAVQRGNNVYLVDINFQIRFSVTDTFNKELSVKYGDATIRNSTGSKSVWKETPPRTDNAKRTDSIWNSAGQSRSQKDIGDMSILNTMSELYAGDGSIRPVDAEDDTIAKTMGAIIDVADRSELEMRENWIVTGSDGELLKNLPKRYINTFFGYNKKLETRQDIVARYLLAHLCIKMGVDKELFKVVCDMFSTLPKYLKQVVESVDVQYLIMGQPTFSKSSLSSQKSLSQKTTKVIEEAIVLLFNNDIGITYK